MHYLESLLKVLAVGLILGAGLPAIFATGMLAYSHGAGGEEADHLIHKPNPALKIIGIAAVHLRQLRHRHRDRLDHPRDDHSPLRCGPVPDVPQEMRT